MKHIEWFASKASNGHRYYLIFYSLGILLSVAFQQLDFAPFAKVFIIWVLVTVMGSIFCALSEISEEVLNLRKARSNETSSLDNKEESR